MLLNLKEPKVREEWTMSTIRGDISGKQCVQKHDADRHTDFRAEKEYEPGAFLGTLTPGLGRRLSCEYRLQANMI